MKKQALLITLILLSIGLYSNGMEPRWWEIYFTTPEKCKLNKNNPENGLINTINKSDTSFYAAFHSLSSQNITDSLIRAKKRGVDIKLVIEKKNAYRESIARLIHEGVQVVNGASKGLMHNKFAVIDKKILWTGSYNLTQQGACRNNDNSLLIRSSSIANISLDEFKEMFAAKDQDKLNEVEPEVQEKIQQIL